MMSIKKIDIIIDKPNSLRNLSINKLFSKRLKTYILALNTTDKKEFLKGMYAVCQQSDFSAAVSIAEVAAKQEIKNITDFMEIWNNRIKD